MCRPCSPDARCWGLLVSGWPAPGPADGEVGKPKVGTEHSRGGSGLWQLCKTPALYGVGGRRGVFMELLP